MKRTIFGLLTIGILLASCIKQDAQVVLQKISISPDTLYMTVGDTQKITPVFTPSTFSSLKVEWSSTDTTVVSCMAGGYLCAKKAGKIWVSVKDKNSSTSGKAYVVIL